MLKAMKNKEQLVEDRYPHPSLLSAKVLNDLLKGE
jgi:hypothetical protein